MGTVLGDAHPSPVSLAFLKSRVGAIAVGLADKVGPLGTWIQQHHSGLIAVAPGDSDAATVLSLTADGAERFAPPPPPAAAVPERGPDAAALASELRGSVFEELRNEAERRRAADELYAPKTAES